MTVLPSITHGAGVGLPVSHRAYIVPGTPGPPESSAGALLTTEAGDLLITEDGSLFVTGDVSGRFLATEASDFLTTEDGRLLIP